MISVIVPIWNAQQWLPRTLDSLLSNEGDFEFVLVNDASTDNSEAIANEYANKDDRFSMFDNEHTKGVSGARNTGIDHAKGEWITFLDDDDELLDNAYETFTHGMKANVNQFNHLRYYTAIDKLTLKYANRQGIYGTYKLPQHWFCVWNKLYRAQFLKDIRFKEGMQYGEDGLFILNCLAKEPKIYHADREYTTVKHRFDNPNSLSKSKTVGELIKQIHLYEEYFHELDEPDMKIVVCKELSKLWDNPNLEKLIRKEADD